MNLDEVRTVDPVLSTHAQGYKPAGRVGNVLFPSVPVLKAGGKILSFGKESFQLYNARRVPGGHVKQMTLGYGTENYSLLQDSLDAKIPREWLREGDNLPGPDIGIRAVNVVLNSLTLALEYEQATLATNTDEYNAQSVMVLTGGDQLSDYDNSNPSAVFGDCAETVRQACGLRPNVAVVGASVFRHLKDHPKVLDRFKYTSADSITADMLAKLFGLEKLAVGDAAYADADGKFHDIWGRVIVMAYAPQTPSGFEEPSFGYTYTMQGNPLVESAAYDRSTHSWLHGVTYERLPVITGMNAGALITNAVAE